MVEAVGSLFAGILASSTALEAFGIDSLIEIVAGATPNLASPQGSPWRY
jgi:divalent metal cation (Fe/Co/Zn/Cd) transporter